MGGPASNGKVPFYFGAPDTPLYGCYHEPRSDRARRYGVILCPPLWYEYVNAHRAYRQLAVRLCTAGFPALQFDYYGSGDSGGDDDQQGIPQCLADISTAIDEMRRRSGLANVVLVGLRLGATLSMMSGAERGDVAGLVLWDPVVSGKAYVQEMRTVHRERLGFSPPRSKRGLRNGHSIEVLGFPLTGLVCADLERVHLPAIRRKPADKTLVIESDERKDTQGLRDLLESTGARVEHQRLHGPRIWLPDREGGLLVPHQILQAVVSWISKVQS
jgi:uncharacterized protein